ncbi:C40 family peptidase [Rhizohabitans arisaemae]|uniref:C40 family peptidase n=1 Tax=Rhizohabitans arisaemae TaxID=2720610 RepID=UPI0024B09E01|nr:C40 family peptidase [Rhizohabitans arisaemae]
MRHGRPVLPDTRVDLASLVYGPDGGLAWRRLVRRRRRMIGVIAVALVATIAADLAVLAEFDRRKSTVRTQAAQVRVQAPAAPREAAPTPAIPAVDPLVLPSAVAPLKAVRKAHLIVAGPASLPANLITRIRRWKAVTSLEVVEAAEVTIEGKRVGTMGVDPSTFRGFTPRLTASSDALWRSVAAGEMAVSFLLGTDGGLKLGRTVHSGAERLRVGAMATVGMGSVDAVVSREVARRLGIPKGNAFVLSAPKADSGKLRETLLKVLPRGTQVGLINPVYTERKAVPPAAPPAAPPAGPAVDSGSLVTPEQVKTALLAAGSKLGRPYVWGAEGPDSFDCSGLVQWAYAQAGVTVPRVTHQQWAAGPQVPFDQLQPGDLIFWRHDPTNPGYISHVAIYWGEGMMIVAPRSGDVVKMSPVTTRNLAGVVRISPAVAAQVR